MRVLKIEDPTHIQLPEEVGEVQGALSIITVAELAVGQMRQVEEEEKVQCLLALFTHIDLNFAIAWRRGGDSQAIPHPPGGCPDRRDRSDPSPPVSDKEGQQLDKTRRAESFRISPLIFAALPGM